MKRKLNEEDMPAPVEDEEAVEPMEAQETPTTNITSFDSLGLEPRLLQAVAKEGFSTPTKIQARAIPFALEGKDILARSKTGSGKTAAYVLPILQSILQRKSRDKAYRATTALILVPTRELAQQVAQTFSIFAMFCSKDTRIVNLTQKIPEAVQRSLLAELPDIVITTPARAAQNIKTSALSVNSIGHLVIDEADLVLSYGYDDDLRVVSDSIPKGLQTFLMSATLTTEVNTLKGLFCRDPVILDLEEGVDDNGGITQYVVKCAEDEKFLLAYVMFKLKLIKGKSIIFVGDIDRCYRLKLFFEQFGIKSCVLNLELPLNSRIHTIQEFNKNVYDIIIAADESEVLEVRGAKSNSTQKNRADGGGDNGGVDVSLHTNGEMADQRDTAFETEDEQAVKQPKKNKKTTEYGVSRGIDFRNISCVLNFDLPTTSKSYTHRIGRTGRAGNIGVALSFVVPADLYHKHMPTTLASTRHDEETLDKITNYQQKRGREVKLYHFDMKQVNGFRYRMNDALRAVTGIAIRKARTRELKQELLKSEKLKRHFEENPEDLQHLRHDGELRTARIQSHLRHVPDYLMPNGKGHAGDEVGFVGLRKTTDNRIRKARMQSRTKGRARKATVKKSDPLKTFNAKGRR